MSIVPRFSPRRIDLFKVLLKAKIEWDEKPEKHIFRVNLRGLMNGEPRVKVEGNQLIITVERIEDGTGFNGRLERKTKCLKKSFQLPDDALAKEGTTLFEEGSGVLTINIPKGDLRGSGDLKCISIKEVNNDEK